MPSPFNPHYKPKKPFARYLMVELGWTLLGLILCAGIALVVATHLAPAQRERLDRDFPPLAQMRARLQEHAAQSQNQREESARERQTREKSNQANSSAQKQPQQLPQLTDSADDHPTTFWGRIGYKFHQWWGKTDKRNGTKQE